MCVCVEVVGWGEVGDGMEGVGGRKTTDLGCGFPHSVKGNNTHLASYSAVLLKVKTFGHAWQPGIHSVPIIIRAQL